MVRDGYFKDVDAVVVWHPGDNNGVDLSVSMANISGKFRFHGVSAHAAGAPERGRSALDAVEVMDVMTNFMREHVPQDTRIHYVITNGGKAPNVVPDFAEVYYVARNKDMKILRDVWDRIVNTAKGAALGTGTTYDLVVTGAVYPYMASETISKIGHRNMQIVGGYGMSADEKALATGLQKSFPQAVPLETTLAIQPLAPGESMGSTDVSDVSWVVPTVQFSAATWVPGTAAHTWQAVVASGGTIGAKGMLVAAKSMALTLADLFQQPQTLAAAKAELNTKRGKDFVYSTYLGQQAPALDYRK
jgi:aminobenzoyl-glutamate utilization protein B